MAAHDGDAAMTAARQRMVEEQIARRDVRDPRVLDAMRKVPRERFVPADALDKAFGDHPVSIGFGQTVSQPYVVALMSEAAELTGSETVLDVGTGCGYQTAVLAELARRVVTIEIVEELAQSARERLRALGYDNVVFHVGDGRRGCEAEAPFDAIVVAAAPSEVPAPLIEQLTEDGRLVIPVGPADTQELLVYRRRADEPKGYVVRSLGAVRFVPLVES